MARFRAGPPRSHSGRAKKSIPFPPSGRRFSPGAARLTAASLERFGTEFKRRCPLHRIGRPEGMAGAAIYLASRAGACITSAVIPVDGGRSIA